MSRDDRLNGKTGGMQQIQWLNERECVVDGVKFLCALDDYSLTTNETRIILLKDRAVLDNYARVFAGGEPRNVLEFGIFQGGSPALFSLWFDVEKFVGIDLSAPVEQFDAFCRTHPIGQRIRSYYGVSQSDGVRIAQIVEQEFGRTPIDLIIDDASHLYETTLETFNIAFPLLRPGGIYVIEDWGWAHWPGSQHLMGRTALSLLIMELVMLCASRSDLVSEIRVFPSFAFVEKSPNAPTTTERFDVRSLYSKRGIALRGTGPSDLSGVARSMKGWLRKGLQRHQ